MQDDGLVKSKVEIILTSIHFSQQALLSIFGYFTFLRLDSHGLALLLYGIMTTATQLSIW